MTLQGRGSSLAAKEVRDAIGERLMTVMMVVRMMMIMIMRVMVVDDLPATTVTSIS